MEKQGNEATGGRVWYGSETNRETNREYVKDPLTHEGRSQVCIT